VHPTLTLASLIGKQESLLLLKAQLAEADTARRAGRVEDEYAAYMALARYFAAQVRAAHHDGRWLDSDVWTEFLFRTLLQHHAQP
jgi:hypothetical protein